MNEPNPSPQQVDAPESSAFVMITVFELALILLAFVIGWWFEFDPRHDMLLKLGQLGEANLLGKFGLGVLATVPLFAMFAAIEWSGSQPLETVRKFMRTHIVPWIAPLPLWQLAMIGVAAGVGEEILFRGAIQFVASRWMVTPLAILLAALLFGCAHYVTWWYALLAAVAGAYLGWLFFATGSLVVPTVAHAAYDIVALIYLARSSPFAPRK